MMVEYKYSCRNNLIVSLGFGDIDGKSSLSPFFCPLFSSTKPIGVSTYHLIETLPKELQSFLPSAEEIAARLSLFDEKEK